MFEHSHFPGETFWMKPVTSSANDPLMRSCEQKYTRQGLAAKGKVGAFFHLLESESHKCIRHKGDPFSSIIIIKMLCRVFHLAAERMLVYALHFNGIYCFCTKQPEEKRRKKCFEARIMPVALYKCIFPFIHLQWIFALLSGALGCVLEREYNNNFA